MTKDNSPVWALRGVRPSTKKLFKQLSALKDERIGELADKALREAAEKGLAEIYGEAAVKEATEKAERKQPSMEPS